MGREGGRGGGGGGSFFFACMIRYSRENYCRNLPSGTLHVAQERPCSKNKAKNTPQKNTKPYQERQLQRPITSTWPNYLSSYEYSSVRSHFVSNWMRIQVCTRVLSRSAPHKMENRLAKRIDDQETSIDKKQLNNQVARMKEYNIIHRLASKLYQPQPQIRNNHLNTHLKTKEGRRKKLEV